MGLIRAVSGIAASRRRGFTFVNAEAETLVAAMAVEPDDTRKAVIDAWFTSAKANGYYTKLDEVWFTAAHTEQAALLGWKRVKDCTAVNAPAFVADRGFTGAIGKYLNTGFVPSVDGVNFTLNDASFGVYARTSVLVTATAIGARTGATSKSSRIIIRDTINQAYYTANDGADRVFASTEDLGLFVSRRTASNARQMFRNGVVYDTNTGVSTALTENAFFILTLNVDGVPAGVFTGQISFAFISASLTADEQLDVFTDAEVLLDAIGAGVVA